MTILEPQASWATWEDLERDALACVKCPLATAGRSQVVFGAGSRDADLVFVGEGPGAEEDKQGIPFVGRAGQLLTRLIEDIGMTRDDVYIANVVKCRPPGNRDPLPEEITSCRPFLESQLQLLAPKVIVTLGNFSTKLLLETKEGITKLRGKQFDYELPGGVGTATLVPTLHPAAVLRNGGAALAQARSDFVVAKRALSRAGSR
jgi:DNA polymerase